jgi:hypothetical protein
MFTNADLLEAHRRVCVPSILKTHRINVRNKLLNHHFARCSYHSKLTFLTASDLSSHIISSRSRSILFPSTSCTKKICLTNTIFEVKLSNAVHGPNLAISTVSNTSKGSILRRVFFLNKFLNKFTLITFSNQFVLTI